MSFPLHFPDNFTLSKCLRVSTWIGRLLGVGGGDCGCLFVCIWGIRCLNVDVGEWMRGNMISPCERGKQKQWIMPVSSQQSLQKLKRNDEICLPGMPWMRLCVRVQRFWTHTFSFGVLTHQTAPQIYPSLIFDPSSWNAGWKRTFHARQSGRKQPAESQRTEHARCQPLLLNLMPLSLPPPVESNLVERWKWVLVTGMSTVVCFELSRRTVPACVSLLHKCP